ncbi:30S ribosomal protein 3-1, chloroplastic [Carica papaya]|uniref:30S ribosomal protein 3-1, chloroplastic n=1 Tax=Carica papaya TaxID=3649 RepID=UPI000B8CD7E6|nr:30S ribosomal protein 3-1, chloroplastic [Carica papaya]
MAIQSGLNTAFFCSSFPSHKPSLSPFRTILLPKPKHISIDSPLIFSRTRRAVPEALTAEPATETETQQEPQEAKVTVKQLEKPRLVLKFVWMEKNIGLALDHVIPGHGTVPLSPYFFWPRKDAWEELKTTLESKPWISQKKMIILLNQATDIINLWQQSGGNLNA